MKITKSQLKQIIKEELGRSLEGYEGGDENLLTDLETITKHLEDIEILATPEKLKSGEQVDRLRLEDINDIHRMAADAGRLISKLQDHVGNMMMRDQDPEPDRYEREERAIRRAGPKGRIPFDPSLYDED